MHESGAVEGGVVALQVRGVAQVDKEIAAGAEDEHVRGMGFAPDVDDGGVVGGGGGDGEEAVEHTLEGSGVSVDKRGGVALETKEPLTLPVALGWKAVVDHVYIGHPLPEE